MPSPYCDLSAKIHKSLLGRTLTCLKNQHLCTYNEIRMLIIHKRAFAVDRVLVNSFMMSCLVSET